MFYMGAYYAAILEMDHWRKVHEKKLARLLRDEYDVEMMRGPMIEADLDDSKPIPGRPMVEGDL